MNKYNPKELNTAIKLAISEGIKDVAMCDCLIFIPEDEQNSDNYINAKRFGYNRDTGKLDYLGDTDIMPFGIDYKEYQMDFVPGGINLFRKDRKKFEVFSWSCSDTVIKYHINKK